MATDRKSRLQEFADWAAANISGDEKRQSHVRSINGCYTSVDATAAD
jgi:hypothetical protein